MINDSVKRLTIPLKAFQNIDRMGNDSLLQAWKKKKSE